MKTKTRAVILLAALVCALLVANAVWAQAGGDFDLSWNTFDGGGATFSTGGAYELGGTIGQADAGIMSGTGVTSTYTLAGGFWGGASGEFTVFLPAAVRQ